MSNDIPPAPLRRPQLSEGLAATEFVRWYWLKEELVQFCRQRSLPTSGSKPEVSLRVESFLAGRPVARAVRSKKRTEEMPEAFSPEMRIGFGWRCGPSLGLYFRTKLGNGFRFNRAMRDFIHHQPGKTLLEAEACYLESIQRNAERAPIASQLEYNQHFRDFFRRNPGATRQHAIDAWWKLRGSRRKVDG